MLKFKTDSISGFQYYSHLDTFSYSPLKCWIILLSVYEINSRRSFFYNIMESFILLNTSVLVYYQLWTPKYVLKYVTTIAKGFTQAAN